VFPFSFRKKLKPEWSFAAQSLIWRILPSEAGILVGEERDPQKRKASFFALAEDSGERLWSDFSLAEDWWVGIEAVHGRVLLFHGYAKPEVPEHRKIIAVSLDSGKILWKNDELTYWFGTSELIAAYSQSFDQRVGYTLDLSSGKVVRKFDNLENLLELRSKEERETAVSGIQSPEILSSGVIKPDVSRVIDRLSKQYAILGDVEYTAAGGKIVVAFHTGGSGRTADEPNLTQHLEVVDLDSGRALYQDVLARNALYPMPDSFFIKNKRIFCVKDQKTLMAIPLAEL